MAKMRAVQVARAGGTLEVVERGAPQPAQGEVRIRVEARGVCHSDVSPSKGSTPASHFRASLDTRLPA